MPAGRLVGLSLIDHDVTELNGARRRRRCCCWDIIGH